MFKLIDGREHLWQWDLDRKVIISDPTIDSVHYCNGTDDCSLVCLVYDYDGQRVADIPNILLQTTWDIRAYGYCGDCYTKHYTIFKVKPRSKPADYVYTETEVETWAKLEKRMDEIEATVTTEGIAQAVENYLKDNPIESGATAEEVAQIEANTNAINEIKNANYLTESELEAKGYITTIPSEYITEETLSTKGFLTEVPAEYVTEIELNDKGYLTEHQSLENYALKVEIPDVSAYQTEEQVIALIQEYGGGGSLPASEEGEF